MNLSETTEFNLSMQLFDDSQEEARQKVAEYEAWKRDRMGRPSGSEFKKLMACTRATTGLDWNSEAKILDFSQTAIKYIMQKAHERKNQVPDHEAFSKSMDWGKQYEPEAIEKIQETLHCEVESCDFILFQENAGTTPDGKIIITEKMIYVLREDWGIDLTDTGLNHVGAEIKCSYVGGNVIFYREEPITPTHEYYWQMQGEMLSLETEMMLFFIYDPRDKEDPLSIEAVRANKIHQEALKIRCEIANKAIDMYIEKKGRLTDHLFNIIEDEYRGFLDFEF